MGGIEALSPQTISRVEQVFRGVVPPERGAANALSRAAAFTNLFSSFYVHSTPFDRALLREVWSGCNGAQPGVGSACAPARFQANQRLDRFELPRGADGGS
jgi:hypothetical protein